MTTFSHLCSIENVNLWVKKLRLFPMRKSNWTWVNCTKDLATVSKLIVKTTLS